MEKKSNISFGIKSINISFLSSFRIPQLLDYIMTSFIVRATVWLVCVLAAIAFGAMFLIGSVNLLKGDKSAKNVSIESQEEATEQIESEIPKD